MKVPLLLAALVGLSQSEPVQPDRDLQMRLLSRPLYRMGEGFFRMVVFSDLLLSSSATSNQDTLSFVNQTLSYFYDGPGPELDPFVAGVDLVVILGNVINGTDWNGQDSSYFQDRWDMLMQVIVPYEAKVAFTLGNLDTRANIKDPYKIVEYINSYGNISLTFPAPQSIDGTTFYGLPIRDFICESDEAKAGYLLFLDSNSQACQYSSANRQVGCVSNGQLESARRILDTIK